jgi:predicted AlkP superfamily phosphohydrolase/phosphomutase
VDPKLLVIGLDGADWRTLDPLLDAGEMPHLRALCDRGTSARLRSVLPSVTAAAWAAFATGMDPGGTGIFNFRALDFSRPGAYHPRLMDSRDLRGHTWLERLPPDSLTCVGLPLTHPPLAVPGVLLSGFPRPRLERAPVVPARWARRLPPWPTAEPGDAAPVSRAVEICALWDRYHAEVALSLLRQRDDRLTICVLSGPDHVAHRLWEGQDGGPAVRSLLTQADRLIGRLVDAAGPRVDVLVLSDHGFGPAPRARFHLNRWLGLHGHLRLREDRGSALLGRTSTALRAWVPEERWRTLRDAVPAPLRDQLYEAAGGIDRIEPGFTRAWGVAISPELAAIQLLDPDAARRTALAEELTDALGREVLRVPGGGPELRATVHRRASIFGGARLGELPELFVELPPGWCWGTRVDEGPVVDQVPAADRRRLPGAHRRDGVLVAAGPGFRRRGRVGETPSLLDVAPTLVGLLGMAGSAEFRGRRLLNWLSEAEAEPVCRTTESESEPESETEEVSPDDRADLERRLRDLGYL